MAVIERLRRAARQSALGLAGGLCLLVGAGFLTVAAWIALSLAAGAAVASLVIGLAYAGLGAVVIAAALYRPERDQAAEPPRTPDPVPGPGMADLIGAFARGMDAGMASRKPPAPR